MWDLWIERFVSFMRKRNFSQRTLKDYTSHLCFFFRFLDSQFVEAVSQVTKDVLRDYQSYLYYFERKGKKLSFDTQYSKLTVVKSFFRFLTREDYLPYNPAADLELPRRKKNLPRRILSPREVLAILEAPRGDSPLVLRDRAILEVLYSTGLRNMELRNLTLFDADLKGGQLRIRDGKRKKERIVPLGECAVRHLRRYLRSGRSHLVQSSSQTLLFVSKNGRQITSANLIWMVKKYLKKTTIGKEITPHSFRHSCATHMLKGKADLRHIQELLGHASVQTTQIYTKVELSHLKEVHRRCHPRQKMDSTR